MSSDFKLNQYVTARHTMLNTITLLIVMLTAAVVAEAQSVSPSGRLKIGYVDDPYIGCGCSMSYNMAEAEKLKFLLLSPMDDATYITVDGKKVTLRLVTASKRRRRERVGDRSWENYSAGNLKVRVEYVVTEVCGVDEEGCEVTNYVATMTVTRGKERRVVKGVASCGC